MPTTTITAAEVIRRHADNIAYAAETDPATTLDALIAQLDTAATNYANAGINGHEDVETAATLLNEAHNSTDDTERAVLLRRADKLLAPVRDMTQEYREMVGD